MRMIRRAETDLQKIALGKVLYAIIIFGLNNLNYGNDTIRHFKGNLHITSCRILICDEVRHSLVYRISGDGFAALLQTAHDIVLKP